MWGRGLTGRGVSESWLCSPVGEGGRRAGEEGREPFFSPVAPRPCFLGRRVPLAPEARWDEVRAPTDGRVCSAQSSREGLLLGFGVRLGSAPQARTVVLAPQGAGGRPPSRGGRRGIGSGGFWEACFLRTRRVGRSGRGHIVSPRSEAREAPLAAGESRRLR